MPGAFDYLYLHLIFSVRNSASAIRTEWRQPLQQTIASVLTAGGHQLMASTVLHDHVHILVRYNPRTLISTMVGQVKRSTAQWLRSFDPANTGAFRWQRGHAIFSVSRSRIFLVRRYLAHQPDYHKQFTLTHEMHMLLETPWDQPHEPPQPVPMVAEAKETSPVGTMARPGMLNDG